MAGLEIKEKREFHLWRWLLTLLILVLVVTCGWFGYRWYTTGEEPPFPIPIASADPGVDETDVTQAIVSAYTVPAIQPRYISIPKLDIEKVRVQKVALDANSLVSMPKNIHDTGWFDKSATPGQGYGAVLINGHGIGSSKSGAFAKLGTLQPSDTITVERGDGRKFKYVVVESETMPLNEVNATGMKKLMLPIDDDKEGLSLIAPAGNWVPRIQQFDHRIMLRAVLADE